MSFKKQIYPDDLQKVDKYINKLKEEHSQIDRLLDRLSCIGDNILIGGALRDIILKNNNPRDLDFIINTDINLDTLFKNEFEYIKNRFGGYKLNIASIEIDIWRMDDHWAFKENVIKKDQNNLKHTTFLNFDAIFYMLESKYIDSEMFNSCIIKNCLDITLDDEFVYLNPSREINVLRMLNIIDEWELKLSDKSYKYIKNWVYSNYNDAADLLYRAQIKHYKFEKIKKERLINIIDNIELYRISY
ncbi:hypothetical protein UT300013_06870 [Paraclostridium sordellii]|uniref:hypothetical protein n=1 Tax=Paraclostridium sordellii TaxID=1505 RepID=UPI001F06E7C2|nr:hypothetical protein [Paeniclostridium sordellii]MCH1966166.1 hypothetical protein [Paeniclostridium sordellii]